MITINQDVKWYEWPHEEPQEKDMAAYYIVFEYIRDGKTYSNLKVGMYMNGKWFNNFGNPFIISDSFYVKYYMPMTAMVYPGKDNSEDPSLKFEEGKERKPWHPQEL